MNKWLKYLAPLIVITLLPSITPQVVSITPNNGVKSLKEVGSLEALEVTFNLSPPPTILPIGKWGKYKISLINRSSKPVTLCYNVYSILNGEEVGIGFSLIQT